MDTNLYFPCDRCGAMPLYGEMVVRSEVRRSDRMWATLKTLERHGLCLSCFSHVTTAAGAAALGMEDPAYPGLPAPVTIAVSDYAHCNFCRSALATHALGVDMVPMTTEFVRRSRYRHNGSIQQHRLCHQCLAWTNTLLHSNPEHSGISQRAHEAGLANWHATVARPAWTSGLIERDDYAVRRVCAAGGFDSAPISLADTRLLPYHPHQVAFVSAGMGRSVRAVKALGAADRARVVVVARPDTADEAMEALKLGAGDVLVSPLSPEQVAGSFERVVEGRRRQRRPDSGLTIYTNDEPGAYELPSNSIQVDFPQSETLSAVYLRLRRFLRGYDRVGTDASGSVRLVVYCPCEDAPTVMDRLRRLLGENSNLRVVARGEPRALPEAGSAAA